MRIGFVGADRMARTIAQHLLVAGHQLVLSNFRVIGTLAVIVAELARGAMAGTR